MSMPPPLPPMMPPLPGGVVPMWPAPAGGGLTKLCPHCLAENEDSAHLCRECLTPMTFFAATVPVFSIWSECDTYRKASRSPAKFIVVLGMWILMGMLGVAFASLALEALRVTARGEYAGGNPMACLLVVPFAAGVGICGTLLARTTVNFFGTGRVMPAARPAPPLEMVDEELVREALAAGVEGEEPGDVSDAS